MHSVTGSQKNAVKFKSLSLFFPHGLTKIVNLQPYDFLALIPVIEGAGGLITDWRGDQLYWEASSDSRPTSTSAFIIIIMLFSLLESSLVWVNFMNLVPISDLYKFLTICLHPSCFVSLSRLQCGGCGRQTNSPTSFGGITVAVKICICMRLMERRYNSTSCCDE